MAALPQCVSRHNSDARPHALTKAVSSGLRGRTDEVILVSFLIVPLFHRL